MSANRVALFDTTLRDGAQAEGVNFSVQDKLHIAQLLDEFGLDYIEGGWPNPTNPKDTEFFERARKEIKFKRAKLTVFGSTRRAKNTAEEDDNLRFLLAAETPAVAIFGKSWDLHVEHVLRVSHDENLRMIEDSCRFLSKAGREVIFDAEHFFDGFKANPEYALATLEAAYQGGASTVCLCDTNGGTMPSECAAICKEVAEKSSGLWGIHVHNDSGCAVANTIIGVEMGASQVQGTTNGWGERCGNADLMTVIPNLQLKLGLAEVSEAQLNRITELSRQVCEIANLAHNERAPYVGASAFAHKGGMHINGVSKVSRSFEHVPPESVGNTRRILVSDQSGATTLILKLQSRYPELDKSDKKVKELLNYLKELEALGYQFESAEATFELLATKALEDYVAPFSVTGFRVFVGEQGGQRNIEASVKVAVEGTEFHTAAEGNGPVNALDTALRKALRNFYPEIDDIELTDYKVRVLEAKSGTATIVRVLVESKDNEGTWGTVSASTDIIEASYQALVDSLEYGLLRHRQQA